MKHKINPIKNLISQINARKKSGFIYRMAIREIKKYQDCYQEKLLLNGEKHYLADEVEEKVIRLIQDCPEILTIQDKDKFNIGHLAAELRLEKIASIALDNEIASIQQDRWGFNIGMYCAQKGMQELALKALDNKIASLQQCNGVGWNIGMYAIDDYMVDASLKAIKNNEARQQKSNQNKDFYSIAVEKGFKPIIEELEKIKETEEINKEESISSDESNFNM